MVNTSTLDQRPISRMTRYSPVLSTRCRVRRWRTDQISQVNPMSFNSGIAMLVVKITAARGHSPAPSSSDTPLAMVWSWTDPNW